ncbi:uncharacterized protein [Nicotiana tomentosiformis]|uniref:uncharacterized protein n=1 Tax=Nicotiana tomentosiformis TaxID=4098 RepID=UPI00388C6356
MEGYCKQFDREVGSPRERVDGARGENEEEALGLSRRVTAYKPPKFEMFDNTDDPKVHLRTYYDKLVGVGKNEQIRMKLFTQSLIKDALSCYVSHNPKKWANRKKQTEIFHEYATRWRSEVAKVRPPLEEEQMNKFFVRA